MLIISLIAELGGWRELGQLYPEPRGIKRKAIRSFGMTSIDLRRGGFPLPVNYSNVVAIVVAAEGLHLRVWKLFAFRHPPLLIPWTEMERIESGHLLFWRTLTLTPRGTSTRIRLIGAPAKAIEELVRQLAGQRAELVGV
ncbi:MAG TPA: hypothetical protein VLK84_08695 [Longimicrobium sp.]|nr:hypothetical protein [Longimicrobium sp.]